MKTDEKEITAEETPQPVEQPAAATEEETAGQSAAETGQPEPQPSEAAAEEAQPLTRGEVEAMIEARLAEAEERGYLRGRNEAIDQWMQQPALYDNPLRQPQPQRQTSESLADGFLSAIRPSIWD